MEVLKLAIWIVLVSLSGVLTPGPMFAATLQGALKRGVIAGVLIALGHLLPEFIIISALWIGLKELLKIPIINLTISTAGGILFIYLGQRYIREVCIPNISASMKGGNYISLLMGFITSAFNPLFIAWWISIGSLFIPELLPLGLLGFFLLIVLHWPLDLVWYSFVAYVVSRGRGSFLRGRYYQAIVVLCGAILLAFGLYFLLFRSVQGMIKLLQD